MKNKLKNLQRNKIQIVENIKEIVKSTIENTQICLFSATYPRRILKITQYFMKNSIIIKIEKDNN